MIVAKLVLPILVVFQNDLLVPVRISVDGRHERKFVIAPGNRTTIRSYGLVRARWEALVPDGGARLESGMLRRGQFSQPRLPLLLQRLLFIRVERRVNRESSVGRFVALLVTNHTADPLTLDVRTLTGTQTNCNCRVGPGGLRVFAGYYLEGALGVVVRRLDGSDEGRFISSDSFVSRNHVVDVIIEPLSH